MRHFILSVLKTEHFAEGVLVEVLDENSLRVIESARVEFASYDNDQKEPGREDAEREASNSHGSVWDLDH